jgi:hypothetical protein
MFGQDNDSTMAVQKESYAGKKPKKSYENDFGLLRKDRVTGAALDPTVNENSTAGVAQQRLRRMLSKGGYKFGDQAKRAGFQFGDDDK